MADQERASARASDPLAGAFADLSAWRKLEVTGADAGGWLNDLVTADLAGLRPGRATGSLLLSPTGGVRASFNVGPAGDGWFLLQDPAEPAFVGEVLERYVLSSDVRLADRTAERAAFAAERAAFGADPPDHVADLSMTPSCLGAGTDLIVPVADATRRGLALAGLARAASAEDVETARVVRGRPRVGIDVTPSDLPQESGLEDLVAFDKGCYLGQESVAKVRNLGHPRRLLLRVTAEAAVRAGEPVIAGGREAGAVTSAAEWAGRWFALVRVPWDRRDEELRTEAGVPLLVRPSGRGRAGP
jgi:folate-binding protein YgfZ